MTSPSSVRRFTVTETREAMEVRADNLDDVAAWCSGGPIRADVVPERGVVMRWDDGRDLSFRVGDVMVRDGVGRFWKYGREEFDRHAAQWEETT